MKKKLTMIAITMAAMVSICGCIVTDTSEEDEKTTETNEETVTLEDITGEDTTVDDAAEENKQKETKVEQINLENAEGSLVYVRHELAKDYNGADAIRIYFTYTNKSDETSTAQSTFYPQVFQNGIECSFTTGDFMEQNEAESNLAKQLMKDSSLEVAFLFSLQDITNPVILKVNDQSVDNLFDNIYQEQELALQ